MVTLATGTFATGTFATGAAAAGVVLAGVGMVAAGEGAGAEVIAGLTDEGPLARSSGTSRGVVVTVLIVGCWPGPSRTNKVTATAAIAMPAALA